MGSSFRDPVCNYLFAGLITALGTITQKCRKRMRELWLAQTGAQPQCDELLAHTPVPHGYDRARYKGSGLSSHLRLHLTKIKQEKPNKCCRWLGRISQSLIGFSNLHIPVSFKPSSRLKRLQVDWQTKRSCRLKSLLLPLPSLSLSYTFIINPLKRRAMAELHGDNQSTATLWSHSIQAHM